MNEPVNNEEAELAKLLSDYRQLVHEHGYDSRQVANFVKDHSDNKKFSNLMQHMPGVFAALQRFGDALNDSERGR